MTCKCVPLTDLHIVPHVERFAITQVHHKAMLSADVCQFLIEPLQTTTYRAGQFINLRHPNGLIRSYSLASLPATDYFLEIQVARKQGGEMSNWLLDTLQAGDALEMQAASGDCYYPADTQTQPMLLIATGTGLSPLFGILRDALHQQHQGDIHLYHGGRSTERFYLRDTLRQMAQQHPHFHYHECLSSYPSPPEGVYAGRADDIAFAHHPDLRGWQVYLAGLPNMVEQGQLRAVAQGATPDAVHTDAFGELNRVQLPVTQMPPSDEGRYPPPDLALWTALREGEMLMAVLRDFYHRVFHDDRLASFFHGVTEQRAIEKQFLFMRQILTGEKIYFGERPRNAHHWMVISDELFDYRAEIMVQCLREHDLSEAMIHRFRAVEEFFRRDIVKTIPFARKMGDVEVPFEGFGEMTMDEGSLCDACEREVSVGEKVIYHVRLGKIYCADCSTQPLPS
jgi:ferredoxin-NADP reductase/truncated hemoglobin YjbI